MRQILSMLACAMLLILAGCRGGAAGPASPAGPDVVARSPGGEGPKTLVRTFANGQGRTVNLYQGRGTGHRGDWGWAHIVDKHIRGHWLDGGIVTTFPEVFGTTSEVQVQDLIGTALAQGRFRNQRGRDIYQYRPPGRRGSVKVVLGSDGTIITAYPER